MTNYAPVTEFSADRCEILASVIEQQPHTTVDAKTGFNMAKVAHSCGTPCCIAGFCSALLGEEPHSEKLENPIIDFLGCTRSEAIQLFQGLFGTRDVRPFYLENKTPLEAAAAIRALVSKRKGRHND